MRPAWKRERPSRRRPHLPWVSSGRGQRTVNEEMRCRALQCFAALRSAVTFVRGCAPLPFQALCAGARPSAMLWQRTAPCRRIAGVHGRLFALWSANQCSSDGATRACLTAVPRTRIARGQPLMPAASRASRPAPAVPAAARPPAIVRRVPESTHALLATCVSRRRGPRDAGPCGRRHGCSSSGPLSWRNAPTAGPGRASA